MAKACLSSARYPCAFLSATDNTLMTSLPSVLAAECLTSGAAFAVITVSRAEGSTPREQGALMVVSADGVAGTIGGGKLEWDAIDTARIMIRNQGKTQTLSVVLGPQNGQCCGGRVTLTIEPGASQHLEVLQGVEDADREARPVVIIHGAGHVGRALAKALALLPFRTLLVDSRAEELARFDGAGVEMLLTASPVSAAENAPAGAAHVIMTHTHALDSLIAAAVLERNAFRYLGIIGSQSKKVRFRNAFRAMGLPKEQIQRVVCPIGGYGVNDKRPEVIAALAAAEITVALLAMKGGH